MLKRVYLHQFNQLGETTVAAIADTLQTAGITEVVCKTHQATTFLGRFDTSALAFNSLDDVKRRSDDFAAHGISMKAWSVPMGLDVNDEADFTAQVAHVLGDHIELDLEPYQQFWDGSKSALLPFLDSLGAHGVQFDINLDIRPDGYQPFPDIGEALKRAGTVYTQSYWTDFGQSWSEVISNAIQTVRQLTENNATPIGIIFPFDGAADYQDAGAFCLQRGLTTIGVWKMGDAGPAVFHAMQSLVDPIHASSFDAFVTRVAGRTNVLDVLGDLWALAEGRRVAGDSGAANDLEAGIIRLKQLVGLP